MWSLNSPGLHFWANSECNLHVPIGAKLDQSAGHIQNVLILCSLGILESHFAKNSKCAQFFTHWVHWSHMAGHIQNVLRMYPLGISRSHSGVYSKCTQHLITGHIGVTCCLCSQCFHNVPSGYLGPCPQCLSVSHTHAGPTFGTPPKATFIFLPWSSVPHVHGWTTFVVLGSR